MDCRAFEEISGVYVLGGLSAGERQEADAHLAQCSLCQHTLRELQSAADFLPLVVPAIAPSPQVKDRIFTAILAEAPPRLTTRVVRETRPQLRQRSWWQHWQTRLVTVAAALLLVLLGVMSLWNISLQEQLASISVPLAATIQGTSADPGASGQAVYLPQWHMTVLVLHNLPQLAGTQVYQGWVLEGGHPKSLGLLSVQNDSATLSVPGDIRGYDAVAVSREPGPLASLDAPKGPVVALGSLPHPQQKTGWRDVNVQEE